MTLYTPLNPNTRFYQDLGALLRYFQFEIGDAMLSFMFTLKKRKRSGKIRWIWQAIFQIFRSANERLNYK